MPKGGGLDTFRIIRGFADLRNLLSIYVLYKMNTLVTELIAIIRNAGSVIEKGIP